MVLSVYVGEFKMVVKVGPEANMKKVLSLTRCVIAMGEPTPLGKYLGCGNAKIDSVSPVALRASLGHAPLLFHRSLVRRTRVAQRTGARSMVRDGWFHGEFQRETCQFSAPSAFEVEDGNTALAGGAGLQASGLRTAGRTSGRRGERAHEYLVRCKDVQVRFAPAGDTLGKRGAPMGTGVRQEVVLVVVLYRPDLGNELDSPHRRLESRFLLLVL